MIIPKEKLINENLVTMFLIYIMITLTFSYFWINLNYPIQSVSATGVMFSWRHNNMETLPTLLAFVGGMITPTKSW